jgi:hypothetical protein
MTMTMKSWLGVIGVGLLVLSVGCTERGFIAPTDLASNATEGAATSSTTTSAVVTLQPDKTANPSTVTVPEWTKVMFVNQSGADVTIQSYNCTEFSLLRIPDGYYRRTTYFTPAGKRCDYFASDGNGSRQIFVGAVFVQ